MQFNWAGMDFTTTETIFLTSSPTLPGNGLKHNASGNVHAATITLPVNIPCFSNVSPQKRYYALVLDNTIDPCYSLCLYRLREIQLHGHSRWTDNRYFHL